MWTQFMDMHSGGGQKLSWAYIYIEAPEDEAAVIFYNRFGRSPHRVTCTCCGTDYSLSSEEQLQQLTGYERNCKYVYVMPDGSQKDDTYWQSLPYAERRELNAKGRYIEEADASRSWRPFETMEDYMKRDTVTFIPASHIKPEERVGSLPSEGYVWAGD